jgi:hypothetical protein
MHLQSLGSKIGSRRLYHVTVLLARVRSGECIKPYIVKAYGFSLCEPSVPGAAQLPRSDSDFNTPNQQVRDSYHINERPPNRRLQGALDGPGLIDTGMDFAGRQWRTERDSNPRTAFTVTHFPGVRLQPLGHLSLGPRDILPGPSPQAAWECLGFLRLSGVLPLPGPCGLG